MKQSIIAIFITVIVTICGMAGKNDNQQIPQGTTETNIATNGVTVESEAYTEVVESERESELISNPLDETVEKKTENVAEVPGEIQTDKINETEKQTKKNWIFVWNHQSNETKQTSQNITEKRTTKKAPVTSPPTPSIPETTTKRVVSNQNSSYPEQVVNLVNEERKKQGLNALVLDKSIEAAAQIRATEIEKSFSHTRPNGSTFSTVLTENGISFRGSGENIAWGQSTPEVVMNGWMNSSGHRANILNSKFKKIGVGYYVGNNGRKYWTQIFTY